jgi:acyl phosphate:glycerol-3-phosphate acyltransferase
MSWIEPFPSVHWALAGGLFVCAYLLGCFTSGYYLVRWLAGKDLRQLGSSNLGARNAGRVLGRPGFFATAVCDVAKGAVAVLVAQQFTSDERHVVIAMIGVVAGHIWPLQLRFQGGKGMATALGTLLAYNFELTASFAALFLILFACFRRSVLPGLFALACVPLASALLEKSPVVLLSAWAALVLFAHRRNFVEEFSLLGAQRHQEPEPDQPL